jgi:hypothetical protein
MLTAIVAALRLGMLAAVRRNPMRALFSADPDQNGHADEDE